MRRKTCMATSSVARVLPVLALLLYVVGVKRLWLGQVLELRAQVGRHPGN
jgi:hypothetical protein